MTTLPDDFAALRAACHARGYALARQLEPEDGYRVWQVERDAFGYWRVDGGETRFFTAEAALRAWLRDGAATGRRRGAAPRTIPDSHARGQARQLQLWTDEPRKAA